MPGRGGKSGGGIIPKKKAFKAKQQKKRFIRSKDPILAVLMWGIQHSTTELTTSVEPSLLLSEDFKAFSKIRVENQYYNKENLPGHFKFKEYCPRVFHNLRKRFGLDDVEYMNSLIAKPPLSIDSPGRSGSKFFCSYDKKLIIKSISSEEVALLHQILQPYHGHVVTSEGKTLLPQYLGCYRLTVNNAESYWIIMRSVFSSSLYMHHKFDLKGSTVDRQASVKEKAKANPTLKDKDFLEIDRKITIGADEKERVMKSLEQDIQLLQRLNLMDYSLLIGIHDCTLPGPAEEYGEEEWLEEDNNGYISSDDIGEPLSPQEDEVPASGEMLNPSTNEGAVANSDGVHIETAAAPADVDETKGPSSPHPSLEAKPESSGNLQASSPELETAAVPFEGATALVPATSHCCPTLVKGDKEKEMAIAEGKYPVIDVTTDVFAIVSSPDTPPHVYFMGLVDVLTSYGARKRAAHAAKTMKHGSGAEISTVKPDQYARRFLDFIAKYIV